MHRLESYEEWLEHDGKTVYLQTETGKPYACYVRVNTVLCRYPYEYRGITVYAEPINKQAKHYRELRRKLGDDWDTDILDSSLETYGEVLQQCRNLA